MKPKDLQKLTGTPGATSVSDVAKGDKPATDDEMEKAYQDLNGEVRQGERSEMPEEMPEPHKPGMVKPSNCADIEEAYAMLFEGLAMIARSHSGEEEQEAPHPEDCGCKDCKED